MITSKDNDAVKLARKLLNQHKHRAETGLFAVEGEDLVLAAQAAGIEPVALFLAGETAAADVLASLSTLPHPARAIGVYRAGDLPTAPRPVTVALWQVTDPGNVGTLMRTADAYGAAIALSAGCSDPLSPKATRAAAGATFRVPIVPWPELDARTIALDAHDGAPLPSADLDLERPVTILLGAERTGLPDNLATQCCKVRIPLLGPAESLNVAAAGAIALYEISSRLADSR
ncbi:MAG: TrmH family RNA methyltransferase [Gaiella sp.]